MATKDPTKDLEAILGALAIERIDHEDGGHHFAAAEHQDIDKARDLSTKYVQAHPEEFAGFQTWGTGQAAIELCVRACETFRDRWLRDGDEEARLNWARCEAWHFHTWEPQNIGGLVAPTIRNILN